MAIRARIRVRTSFREGQRGEPDSARAELEKLIEDSKPHHADPSTGYYVGLARKLLERARIVHDQRRPLPRLAAQPAPPPRQCRRRP